MTPEAGHNSNFRNTEKSLRNKKQIPNYNLVIALKERNRDYTITGDLTFIFISKLKGNFLW